MFRNAERSLRCSFCTPAAMWVLVRVAAWSMLYDALQGLPKVSRCTVLQKRNATYRTILELREKELWQKTHRYWVFIRAEARWRVPSTPSARQDGRPRIFPCCCRKISVRGN